MRLALISTTTYSSPCLHYGGETYYWNLARGLCELGHSITLYGAPGSLEPHPNCRCRLKYIPGTYGAINTPQEWKVVDWYWREIMAHDIILDAGHCHTVAEEVGWYYKEDQTRVVVVLNGVTSNTPRCGLYNVVVGSQKWKDLLLMGRTQFYSTPLEGKYSGSLTDPVPPNCVVGVVPWRLDTGFYVPVDPGEVDSYYLWLGRATDYKGLDHALKVAAMRKLHLVVAPASGVEEHRRDFATYQKEIEQAREAGARVDVVHLPLDSRHHYAKRDLMARAKALLYPIKSHEPWGMITTEALSCGTPVVAYSLGAMPEIIKDGETGFLCESENLDEMAEAVGKIDTLDRHHIRDDSRRRWHYLTSAQEYLDIITD